MTKVGNKSVSQRDTMPDIQSIPNTHQFTLSNSRCYVQDAYNEMYAQPGVLRPHWQYLGNSLDELGLDELKNRYSEARRLIRDNDVTYTVYNDPQGMGRPWDLDLLPLLFESDEWGDIEAGLMQRAELLNLLLADIYGARSLIKNNVIPIELIYNFPGFMRPCDGIVRADGRYLHLYAADLVRGVDGGMQVIADRTQAPSGAGYALENRIVLTRVLPSLFRDSHVHRLAGFFRTMRNTLNTLANQTQSEPNIVLLSPGAGNETYFEHAYLANYLGYTLVEGADLTVRDDHVWLRTLHSLQRVDVILRRVDDAYCDPLELREDSYLGVPGLLQAVRAGNVTVANPLGSGVLQNPALMAFMPAIARHFFGEDLRLPNVETWWCGLPEHNEYVIANFDQLVIKPYMTNNQQRTIFCSQLSPEQRSELMLRIQAKPHLYTAQRQLDSSVAPVLANLGQFESRHAVLRSYLVAEEDGYMVMPGGLTRVSAQQDDYLISSQAGGASKDTWVIASEPEKQDTLFVQSVDMAAAHHDNVPSRVADNLFWIGRYAERSEGLVRLMRVIQMHLADGAVLNGQGSPGFAMRQLLYAVTHQTMLYPGFVGEGSDERIKMLEHELLNIITDDKKAGSLAQTLSSLLFAARSVRDRLSMDTLRVINDIDSELFRLKHDEQNYLNDVDDELDNLITALVGLSGLINENMVHEQGWRFLEIGRRVERAWHTVTLLRSTLVSVCDERQEALILESVLGIIDSLMTYKRSFKLGIEIQSVLELVLHEEINPRSIIYQLLQIQQHIAYLPKDSDRKQLSTEERIILELVTNLRLTDTKVLVTTETGAMKRQKLDVLLAQIQQQLVDLSDALSTSYFEKLNKIHQLVPTRPELEQ